MIRVPKEVSGYDILVWQKSRRSPTYCCGYTDEGAKFLKKLSHTYVQGLALELNVYPIVFIRSVPKKLRVGGVGPKTKKVRLISGDPLH